MGKNTYNKCLKIIEDNFDKGDVVGIVKLSALIQREIGADPRTVYSCLKIMSDQKMIKDINNCHFRIMLECQEQTIKEGLIKSEE